MMTMELIDRYVGAVGARLSSSRRAAVEAELRAAILDDLDGRGSGPDDEAVVVEVLREFGEPGQVAARYEPSRQYLIGPELYPMFRRVTAWLLGSLVAGGAIAVVVRLLLAGLVEADASAILAGTVGSLVRAAIVGLTVLVVVFVLLQRAEVRLPRLGGSWDPRSLTAVSDRDRVSQFDAIVALGSALIAMVVVDGLMDAAVAAMARTSVELRPLVQEAALTNLMLIQVMLALTAVVHALALAEGRWRAYTLIGRLVAELLALFVFVRLPFQVIAHRADLIASGFETRFVDWLVINLLVVAAIWLAVFVVQQIRAFRRAPRGRSAARDAGRSMPPTAPAARA